MYDGANTNSTILKRYFTSIIKIIISILIKCRIVDCSKIIVVTQNQNIMFYWQRDNAEIGGDSLKIVFELTGAAKGQF